jgi:hypothetical protein
VKAFALERLSLACRHTTSSAVGLFHHRRRWLMHEVEVLAFSRTRGGQSFRVALARLKALNYIFVFRDKGSSIFELTCINRVV